MHRTNGFQWSSSAWNGFRCFSWAGRALVRANVRPVMVGVLMPSSARLKQADLLRTDEDFFLGEFVFQPLA